MPTPLTPIGPNRDPGAEPSRAGCQARRGEPAASTRTGRGRGVAGPLPDTVRSRLCICAAIGLLGAANIANAAQVVIPGPAGSSRFGTAVAVLPNGDFVVTDPQATGAGGITSAGAVHHYRPDGTLVATLRGARANDFVGIGGILVLANGNYLIRSPGWDNGTVVDAGAITFVRGDTGLEGVVSPTNSLVGSASEDLRFADTKVFTLDNGNYVVIASDWDSGATSNAVAVVFGNGVTGVSGPISASNALIGSRANDRIGSAGFHRLANGNWLVRSPDFDAATIVNAGAVTLGSGLTGRSGVVSAANSLVGTSAGDRVGVEPIGILANGNYVVRVPDWDNGPIVDAGAAVFGSGTSGVAGPVTTDKALFGSSASDRVGSGGITPLPSGAYLVASPNWRNGSATNAGAVTFGNGSSGIIGAVSATNSLVGVQSGDGVGSRAPVVLANGNWVIGSPTWDNGTTIDAGAVTFGFGTTGRSGAVATTNSLTGSTTGDRVGDLIVALTGGTSATVGGYVVASQRWDGNGGVDVGAVTMLTGTGGISGAVSTANSLVGARSSDFVGSGGVFALPDGRYVVASPRWDNGPTIDVGAVTLRNANLLEAGVVSTSNSLVGAGAGDEIGSNGVVPLPNAAFLVRSPKFSVGAATGAGAITWVPAVSGRVATVSSANSLVGSRLLDGIGGGGTSAVTLLDDGDAVVTSPFWDNGTIRDAGAVTHIDRNTGRSGPISALNSLVGGSADDFVGFGGFDVAALPGGRYLVASQDWTNGAVPRAGAVTYGADDGTVGLVSPANSIVGSTQGDLNNPQVLVAANGNFILRTTDWDNGAVADAGAFTLGLTNGSVTGPLTTTHSVLGTVAGNGDFLNEGYDPERNQLVVGEGVANRVVLHRSGLSAGCGIVPPSPNPSDQGATVTFRTSIFASETPSGIRVTVRASNGQQCVDNTGTVFSPGLRTFSCSITFN